MSNCWLILMKNFLSRKSIIRNFCFLLLIISKKILWKNWSQFVLLIKVKFRTFLTKHKIYKKWIICKILWLLIWKWIKSSIMLNSMKLDQNLQLKSKKFWSKKWMIFEINQILMLKLSKSSINWLKKSSIAKLIKIL